MTDAEVEANLRALSDETLAERLRTFHDKLGDHLIRTRDQPLFLMVSRAIMAEAARRISP